MKERALSHVPATVKYLLVVALGLQIGWQASHERPVAKAEDLVSPPALAVLNLGSLGEPVALAKLLMLYVQAFDVQPGVSLSYRDLDYSRLKAWLERVLALDPQSQYPLFAAGHLYGLVADQDRQRQMLDFIYQQFSKDPNRRWPALAHAVTRAKHGLKDLPLARRYAEAIRIQATGANVPHWAQQMEAFLLDDMGELDAAKLLIGALLQSGQITDVHEMRLLEMRLADMAAKSARGSQQK